jgi:SnoaL-like domain
VELWEIEARLCIVDLICRYNSTADSGRFAETLALFAPDAVVQSRGIDFRGLDAIESIFTSAKDRFVTERGVSHVRHSTSTHQIDVESPSEARSRCYFTVVMDAGLVHWGVYSDRFRRLDGRSLFSERRIHIEGELPRSHSIAE